MNIKAISYKEENIGKKIGMYKLINKDEKTFYMETISWWFRLYYRIIQFIAYWKEKITFK